VRVGSFVMSNEKSVAIIVPDHSERRTLSSLLLEEGFVVDSYASTREFASAIDLARCGCLIVDSELSTGGRTALSFAERWSQKLPVILITSEAAELRQVLPVPGVARSAGENRLLYLVYGALSQSTPQIA
jgi:DNA-binding NtrC family response regulator